MSSVPPWRRSLGVRGGSLTVVSILVSLGVVEAVLVTSSGVAADVAV